MSLFAIKHPNDFYTIATFFHFQLRNLNLLHLELGYILLLLIQLVVLFVDLKVQPAKP
jgi:hypothetical protein